MLVADLSAEGTIIERDGVAFVRAGRRIRLSNGRVLVGPARSSLERYEARVVGDLVVVGGHEPRIPSTHATCASRTSWVRALVSPFVQPRVRHQPTPMWWNL